MTIEEKARAYDEAIGKAQDIFHTSEFIKITDLFPDLAESEDERMLREIKRYLKEQGDKPTGLPNGTVAVSDMIAWLEKQKEQSWMPTEEEMGVLYKLCYVSTQISDDDDTELTRLYQDLKREYFNGHSFENMFPSERQKEQKSTECIEFANEFENQVSHLLASVLNGEYEYNKNFIKYAAQSLLGYAKNELKSTEWSKEDENARQNLIAHFEGKILKLSGEAKKEAVDWLKSLRPSLQQEQSEELEKKIDDWYNTMGIPVTTDALKETARHFYELGRLNARKED